MERYTVKDKLIHKGRAYPEGFGVNLTNDEAIKYYKQGKINRPEHYEEEIGPTNTQELRPSETKADDSYTVRELRKIASDKNISNYSSLRKDELIDAINGSES